MFKKNILATVVLSQMLTAAALPAMAQETDSIRTHVDIELSGYPDTKQLLIYEAYSDIRFGLIATHDVVNGKCSFDLSTDVPREMEIIFDNEFNNGSWKIKKFYAEGDTIRASYYGNGERTDIISSSGTLQTLNGIYKAHVNDAMGEVLQKYRSELEEMERSGEAVIEEVRPLYLQMKSAKGERRDSLLRLLQPINEKYKGDIYSQAYKMNIEKQSSLALRQDTIRWDYLVESTPSLFGLMEIRGQLYRESPMQNVDEAMERLEHSFKAKYADFASHPYFEECKLMFATRKLRPGKKYDADYKIHSVDGKESYVSELTKGKPAIIDLWASWCGPCRRNSKALIPVYEKYKPLGLAYVAVARESGNADAMLKAMEHDDYPWQSYIDIDDADGIWAKNGCPNSGGRIFLIDADGVIVHVDPTIDKIEEYLEKTFQNLPN